LMLRIITRQPPSAYLILHSLFSSFPLYSIYVSENAV